MRIRQQEGNSNTIGVRVAALRKAQGLKQKDFLAKLQIAGLDINASGLSKLEGQLRMVTDKEIVVICRVLHTDPINLMDWRG